jgi:predicted N-acetyltransferase YhbS
MTVSQRLRLIVPKEALKIGHEQRPRRVKYDFRHASYGRFGFKADPNPVLRGVPAEYFQAISFDSSRPKGFVAYDESFNASG